MKIEVVLFVPPNINPNGRLEFENVESVIFDTDAEILSVYAEDDESIAYFKDWTYWRKLSD